MEHVEPDVLALVALGEPVDDATRDHLTLCEGCSVEVTELAAVVATARTVTVADAPLPAPARVWAAISDELQLDGTTPPGAASATSGPAGSTTSSTRTQSARRRPAQWALAAAVGGLMVGGAGGAWLAGLGGDPAPPVVAQADLDPLPGWEATAQARVHQADDGTRQLVVVLDGGETDAAFREVWLIDRDVTRLVSLGILEGTEGTFTVPADLDLSDFAVVDVSAEPPDGDPAHSGDSIVRGVLDT